MFNKTLFKAVVLTAFACGLQINAAVLDNSIEIPVKVHVQFNSNDAERTITLGIYKNGTLVGSSWSKTGTGTAVQSVPEKRDIETDENHILKMEDTSGSPGITSYTVRVTVPPGYQAWIGAPNGQAIATDLYSASGTLSDPDDLVLRVTKQRWDSVSAPLGTSPSLREYDVDWRVSMGTLSNGKSAGWLSVSEGSSIYNLTWESDDLSYSVSSDEVEIIKSAGKIRQIFAPQGLADVIDTSSSDDKFIVKIYSWVDVGSKSGGIYTIVSGAVPIYQYTVEKPVFTYGYPALMVTKRAYTENNGTQYEEWRTVVRYAATNNSWYLWDWTTNLTFHGINGLTSEREVLTSYLRTNASGHWQQQYTLSTYNSSSVLSHKEVRVFNELPWGLELEYTVPWVSGAWDYNQKVSHEYYDTTATEGKHQQLKKTTYGDGTTVEYEYYDNFEYFGKVSRKKEPFENSQAGKNTDYFYTSDGSGDRYLLDLVYQYETANNKFIFGTDYSYSTFNKLVLGSTVPIRVTTQKDNTTLSNTITTVIKTFREDSVVSYLRGMPYAVMRPDGTQDSFYHSSSGSNIYQQKYSGRTPESSETGYDLFGHIEEIMLISNHSTMEKSTAAAGGVTTKVETYAWKSGTTFELFSAIDLDHDEAARLTERSSISYTNGSQSGSNILWSGEYKTGLLDNTIDETGALTEYVYDTAARVSKKISIGESAYSGLPVINDLYTIYTYNSYGQVTSEVSSDNSGGTGETIETTYVYDTSGRLTSKTADCCMTVNYTYGLATGGGTWSKSTNPDGGYTTTTLFRDGNVKSVTGTAVASEKYFDYDVTDDGLVVRSQKQTMASPYKGVDWKHIQYDLLSRKLWIKEPAWTSTSTASERYTVNVYSDDTGQLLNTSIRDGSPTNTELMARKYYTYHEAGYVELEGLDLDGSSGISTSSTTDRIVKHEYKLEEDGSSKWWMAERTFDYPDNTTTAVEVSETKHRLNPPTNTLSEVFTEDAFGKTTTATRTVTYSQALVTDTISHGEGITGDAVRRTRLGMVQDYSSEAGVETSYLYDDLRRNDFELGRDDVLMEYTYVTDSRRVSKVSDKYFDLIEYDYDSSGRVDYIKKHNASTYAWTAEETFLKYDTADRKTYQWGNADIPAKWEYDSYGRLQYFHHYKDHYSDWDSAAFPSTPFSAYGTSRIKFDYNPETSQLYKKTYYEGSTLKYDLNYSYKKLGQKYSEENARGQYTWYNYDSDTQDLDNINYPSGMTDEYFYYTRAGRVNRVDDASGRRDFVYDTTDKIRVQFEQLDSSFYSGKDLEYTWQTGSGSGIVPGRASGVKFGTHNGGTSFTKVYSALYTFNGTGGRLNGVDAYNTDSGVTKDFNYDYQANSNLIQYLKLGTGQLHHNYWDAYRDVRYKQQSKWNGTVKADYDVYNTKQRQQYRYKLNTGALSTAYGYPSTTIDTNPIAYNTRGEVTGYTNNVWNNSSYVWDRAGNPTSITRGGATDGYTANGRNQIFPTSGGSFTYDTDGNLTSDTKNGRSMVYNAKNQLTKITDTSSGWYYEFKYDFLGRRVEKKSVESTTTTTRFVYHGWNLIGELNTSGTLQKSYYWGLDKKSSISQTSGVEALLMIRDHVGNKNYYPIYDTRGNISGLKDDSGNVVAAYDYDPFGRLVHISGTAANVNPFGFQTKYTDRETNLVYFGHRYYDPITNRWINRDPIQEAGGMNLYAMVGNDPVNSADFLGLEGDDDSDSGEPDPDADSPCSEAEARLGGCEDYVPVSIVGTDGRGNVIVAGSPEAIAEVIRLASVYTGSDGSSGLVWDGSFSDGTYLGYDSGSFVRMDGGNNILKYYGVGNSVAVERTGNTSGWNLVPTYELGNFVVYDGPKATQTREDRPLFSRVIAHGVENRWLSIILNSKEGSSLFYAVAAPHSVTLNINAIGGAGIVGQGSGGFYVSWDLFGENRFDVGLVGGFAAGYGVDWSLGIELGYSNSFDPSGAFVNGNVGIGPFDLAFDGLHEDVNFYGNNVTVGGSFGPPLSGSIIGGKNYGWSFIDDE